MSRRQKIYNEEKYVIVTKPKMSFLAITVCAFVVLDVPKAGTIWDIFLFAACLYIFGNLSILRLCPLLIFYWHSTGRTTTRELTSQVYLDKNANQRKFKYNIPLHHTRSFFYKQLFIISNTSQNPGKFKQQD